MEDDLEEEDLSELADGLLEYCARPNLHQTEIQDLADELLSSSQEPGSNPNLGPGADEVEDELKDLLKVQDPVACYGRPDVLSYLGNPCQQQLMKKVWAALASKKKRLQLSKAVSTIFDNFVCHGPLKSLATAANDAATSISVVTRNLEATACVMLQGGCWMLGASLQMWRSQFRNKSMTPLLCISQMSYDETPLRLRIAEFNQFVNSGQCAAAAEAGVARRAATKATQAPLTKDDYRFCKIFRVHWRLGPLAIAFSFLFCVLSRVLVLVFWGEKSTEDSEDT